MESVGFGLGDSRGRQDSLLLHPVGLGTQDETEKVFVWNSCSFSLGGWSSAPLVIKSGALKQSRD